MISSNFTISVRSDDDVERYCKLSALLTLDGQVYGLCPYQVVRGAQIILCDVEDHQVEICRLNSNDELFSDGVLAAFPINTSVALNLNDWPNRFSFFGDIATADTIIGKQVTLGEEDGPISIVISSSYKPHGNKFPTDWQATSFVAIDLPPEFRVEEHFGCMVATLDEVALGIVIGVDRTKILVAEIDEFLNQFELEVAKPEDVDAHNADAKKDAQFQGLSAKELQEIQRISASELDGYGLRRSKSPWRIFRSYTFLIGSAGDLANGLGMPSMSLDGLSKMMQIQQRLHAVRSVPKTKDSEEPKLSNQSKERST